MSKKATIAGRVISWAIAVFLIVSGVNVAFVRSPGVAEGFAQFGYPPNVMVPIGLVLLASSILYLIPRTSILGAILLTGYLGGAVATHVRINDPTLVAPLIVGVAVWFGLWIRDERIRTLIPMRD